MMTYLLRRVLGVLIVGLGVLTITFFLVSMIPGDVAVFYAGPHATGQVIEETRHALGLDQPKYIQYFNYLWQTLQGNFGQSATLDEPVLTAIVQRLPQTAHAGGRGDPAGDGRDADLRHPLLALRGRSHRSAHRGLAALGISMPGFWLGTVLLFVVAYKLSLLPLGGYGDPVIIYLILPAVTVGVPGGLLVCSHPQGQV